MKKIVSLIFILFLANCAITREQNELEKNYNPRVENVFEDLVTTDNPKLIIKRSYDMGEMGTDAQKIKNMKYRVAATLICTQKFSEAELRKFANLKKHELAIFYYFYDMDVDFKNYKSEAERTNPTNLIMREAPGKNWCVAAFFSRSKKDLTEEKTKLD